MTESNVWCDSSEHLHDGSVDLQEHTIMELLESEKLQDLSWLGGHLVDTDQSGSEQELGFGLNKEVAILSGLTSKSDQIGFASSVLLHVLDGSDLELLSGLDSSLKHRRISFYEGIQHTCIFLVVASVFCFLSSSL